MVLRNYSSKSTRPFAREVSHHKTPSGLSVSYLALLAAFLPLRTHLFPIYDRCDTKEGYLVGHVSRGMAYFEMSSIWQLRIRSGKLSLRDIVAITRFFQQNSTPFTPASGGQALFSIQREVKGGCLKSLNMHRGGISDNLTAPDFLQSIPRTVSTQSVPLLPIPFSGMPSQDFCGSLLRLD